MVALPGILENAQRVLLEVHVARSPLDRPTTVCDTNDSFYLLQSGGWLRPTVKLRDNKCAMHRAYFLLQNTSYKRTTQDLPQQLECRTVSGFLMGLSVIGSIFNITGIAINRYCYICHSFSYDKLYSYRNTLLLVALIWLLTVIAIVPNFFVGSLQYDPRIYSCTFAQTVSTSYTITVVVIHFFVPIAVVTFCYLRIWILVIQVRRKVKSEIRPRIKPSDLRNFITMFVVFVLFAICWAPLNFIGLAVAINPEAVVPRIPEWLFVVSYFMAYFNSCLNAIIYGLLNQNFRREYKRIIMSVWMPHLFFQETSRGGTEGMKSKPSPGLNNNEQVQGETL
ncbi:melatonin receptor type 1B-like [Morone saxatilis]|uniref:melatonin receptor type 1B-like n=1 Tax=Morone saxatilis TaxID=34816 RepID=UPI0015E1E11D|nr:melatonin receptor type 1B-like [Morone saxatilis]